MSKKQKIILSIAILIVAIVGISLVSLNDVGRYFRTYVAFPTVPPAPQFPAGFGDAFIVFGQTCYDIMADGFPRDLVQGYSGQDVQCWQMTLNLINAYGDIPLDEVYKTGSGSLGQETSSFEGRTVALTTGFQYFAGLPQTGRADSITRKSVKDNFLAPLVSEIMVLTKEEKEAPLLSFGIMRANAGGIGDFVKDFFKGIAGVAKDKAIETGKKVVDGTTEQYRDKRLNEDCQDTDGLNIQQKGTVVTKFIYEIQDAAARNAFLNTSNLMPTKPLWEYKTKLIRIDECIPGNDKIVKEWLCLARNITRYKEDPPKDQNGNYLPPDKITPQQEQGVRTETDKGQRGIGIWNIYYCPSGYVCQDGACVLSSSSPTPFIPASPTVPTPTVPTPAAPSPTVPTPAAPTPVAPTPAAPTPTAPSPSPNPQCIDYDNGKNAFTASYAYGGQDKLFTRDRCISPTYLLEAYCNGNVRSMISINCSALIDKGVCQSVSIHINEAGLDAPAGYCIQPSPSPSPSPSQSPRPSETP